MVSRLQGAAHGTGPLVVCGTGGAGRDGDVFDGPEEPTLDRLPHACLAFGFGPRSRLGLELARAELQTVLDVLLRRLPSLELAVAAEDLRRLEGLAVGGLREVPVRW
jgi:cytochrome P450